MTDDEMKAYLAAPHLCTIGTIGADGGVHLVAMNYGFIDDAPAFWTYRRSQKVKNLERNPHVSFLVHSGTKYAELKGVQIAGQAEIVEDTDRVLALFETMGARYGNPGVGGGARESAPKRVAVRIRPDKVVSWDHGKLGGAY
jgi:PPOX class probable F420-dependent enzyme